MIEETGLNLIREIRREDLTEDFFELLSQLSGEVIERDSDKLWRLYNKMKPGIVTVVRLNEGKVEGTATVLIENKFLHCGSRVAHIEDVVVHEGSRTKGLGKELIERCLQIAKDNKCYKVILDCNEEIIPFYAKCGFRPDGYCMRAEVEE
jgi:glucosamine-phosphate N-acetyltransferase